MQKKTNWWVIAGILGILGLGISAIPDTAVQPAHIAPAPSAVETQTLNFIDPQEATAVEAVTAKEVDEKPSAKYIPLSERSEPEPTPNYIPLSERSSADLSNDNYYTNSEGNSVHSPAYTEDDSVPDGASAICEDGTYSFSQNRRGTCSHHGGVAQWL